jgi:YYY domain-containing protein
MASLVAFGAVVVFVGALGRPLATTWFAHLPARGAGLACAVGLLALLWLTWLPPAVGAYRLGMGSTLAGLALLGALAVGLALRRRRSGRAVERVERVVGRATIAVLLVAYGAWALMRSLSPGYASGEQPMDHAFVAAILRSDALPPTDPWLAGEQLDNYYYGVHFLVADLTRLSGVDVSTAFNLSVAMFFALCAATVFALTAELALLARARLGVALWAGGAAAALAMLAGNPAGGIQLLLEPASLIQYDWWEPSRVVDHAINEFPFFAFVFGEMHAHMLSVPTLLLAVAGSVQLALAGPGRGRALVLGAAALGFTGGSLAFLNAWDQPTAALIALAGAIAWLVEGDDRTWRRRLAALLAFGAVAAVVAVAAWLPYLLRFHGPPLGLRFVDPERDLLTAARDFGLMFGLLAWIVAAYTAHALIAVHGGRRVAIGALALGLAAAAAALAGLGGLALFVLAVTPPAVAACARSLALAHRLGFVLAAAALALALVGEVLIVQEAFGHGPFYRQNTVFKFGYHAWFLLAIAGAALVARPGSGRLLMRWHWQAGLGVLIGLCLVYPIAGSIARTQGFAQGPDLDLLEGLQRTSGGDAAAVRWLREHVPGTPTLVEAIGNDYTPAARMSSLTGIPAVVAWPGHEMQWGRPTGFQRRDLVDELYATVDRRRAYELLAQFGVRFVIVGSLERVRYPAPGLEKFDELAGRAYERDGTIVYDVRRSAHAASVAGAPGGDRG